MVNEYKVTLQITSKKTYIIVADREEDASDLAIDYHLGREITPQNLFENVDISEIDWQHLSTELIIPPIIPLTVENIFEVIGRQTSRENFLEIMKLSEANSSYFDNIDLHALGQCPKERFVFKDVIYYMIQRTLDAIEDTSADDVNLHFYAKSLLLLTSIVRDEKLESVFETS